MVFCCFSDEPLGPDERHGSYPGGGEFWRSPPGHKSFQVRMMDAPCKEPCCCCVTCITATYGTSWCLRREVLKVDHPADATASFWTKYRCCQGHAPCCNSCLEGCVCCSGDGRCCCMCLECLLCPGLAISATRVHLMIADELLPDPTDFQIMRFNNCIQCLACICDTLAICVRDLRHVARLVDLFAHIVFMCTAGCMAAQIHHEVKHVARTLEAEDREAALIKPVEHSSMDGPAPPPAYIAPEGPDYGMIAPPPLPPPPPAAEDKSNWGQPPGAQGHPAARPGMQA